MTTETIRALDYLVGNVVCALLTLHRRLRDRFRPGAGAAPAAVRRILFLKLVEQGATVLAYDAIRRATERVGRANVYFCVFAENRDILDVMDVLPAGNVFVVRSGGLAAFVADVWRVIGAVRRARIDAVIDLEFMSRASAILAYLTGGCRRVGLHRFTDEAPYRGDLMTHRVLYNPAIHTARAYALLVEALDADPADAPLMKVPVAAEVQPAPCYAVGAAQRQHVQALLDAEAGRRVTRPLVLFNPNCRDTLPLRRWPSDRFVALGRRLLGEDPEVTIALTGAPPERPAAAALCAAIGSSRVVNLAGRTTLRDLLALYDMADVLVTNDSGPGHFAALTAIEAVVLFGPAAPSQFGPVGGRGQVLWAGLACSPCATVYNHRSSVCTNNVCMQVISVDQVYACVAAALRAAPRPRGGRAPAERA